MSHHFRVVLVPYVNKPLRMLTAEQRRSLAQYKYSGGDSSLLYKYILSPLADHSVSYIPLWVAPNVITALGLAANTFGAAINLYINPNLENNAPRWLFLVTAMTLFMYQNLDNMDGKQARRTGSSSPLGLMMDHGCDSISLTLLTISMSSCFGVGWKMLSIYCFVFEFLSFFIETWEEVYTGSMVLPIINSATDGIAILITCNLISAYYGSYIWFHPCIDATAYFGAAAYTYAGRIPNEAISMFNISVTESEVLLTPISLLIAFIFVVVTITNTALFYSGK